MWQPYIEIALSDIDDKKIARISSFVGQLKCTSTTYLDPERYRL